MLQAKSTWDEAAFEPSPQYAGSTTTKQAPRHNITQGTKGDYQQGSSSSFSALSFAVVSSSSWDNNNDTSSSSCQATPLGLGELKHRPFDYFNYRWAYALAKDVYSLPCPG